MKRVGVGRGSDEGAKERTSATGKVVIGRRGLFTGRRSFESGCYANGPVGRLPARLALVVDVQRGRGYDRSRR